MEVSEILYQAIFQYEEKRILSDIAQGESSDTIRTIYDYCISSLENLGANNPETRGALAEGLVHYLLTVALIPSQRKTTLQTIPIDVAVPDSNTLERSPENAVVIFFPKTGKDLEIRSHLDKMKQVQPRSENIWVVSDKSLPTEAKFYTLDKNGFTFSNIINDLISFSSNRVQSKLKIFKI